MEHSLAAKQNALSNLQRYRNRPIIAAIKQMAANKMSRQIGFYAIEKDGKGIRYLSMPISILLDCRHNDNCSITVRGCGMDMIFATLYRLNCIIYDLENPDGGRKFDHALNYFFDADSYIYI